MLLIGGISVFCDEDLATPSPHGDIRRLKGPGSFKHYKASELQQKFGITPRGLDRYRHTYSATGGGSTYCVIKPISNVYCSIFLWNMFLVTSGY